MKFIIMMLLVLTPNVQAAEKSEVWDLLQRIDSELRYYEQTPRQLDEAKIRLEEVLRILRQGGVVDPNACLDFAIDEYVRDGFSNTSAMQRAKSLCSQMERDRTALAVVRYFYTLLKADGYSGATSLQIAADTGRGMQERKLECIQPAYDRYKQDGFSNRTALTRAIDFCKS
jgi:hypothetical protein